MLQNMTTGYQCCILGMHDIGFSADIRYCDILQLIWPIIDTDTSLTAEIIESLLWWNLHKVLLCVLMLCRPAGKCRHKIQSLKHVIFLSCAKEEKYLNFCYIKRHIYL